MQCKIFVGDRRALPNITNDYFQVYNRNNLLCISAIIISSKIINFSSRFHGIIMKFFKKIYKQKTRIDRVRRVNDVIIGHYVLSRAAIGSIKKEPNHLHLARNNINYTDFPYDE